MKILPYAVGVASQLSVMSRDGFGDMDLAESVSDVHGQELKRRLKLRKGRAALDMRRAGYTFVAIAESMGISNTRAQQLVRREERREVISAHGFGFVGLSL